MATTTTPTPTPKTDPDVPLAVRLRRALKALLRSYDLRCLSIRDVQPPAQVAAAKSEADFPP